MKKIALHWRIMIGLVLGIIFGFIALANDLKGFVTEFILPIGKIFVNLLKLIAVPLIIGSLIKGISDLKNISKLKKIGLKTISIYIVTTLIAIVLGLGLVNIVKPGGGVSKATVEKLSAQYANDKSVLDKIKEAKNQKAKGRLDFLVDLVPSNAIDAMSENKKMLQVIIFTIFIAISMLLVGEEKSKPLKKFFDSLNDVMLEMVDLIMLISPFAVFALMSNVVVSISDPSVLFALLKYAGTVVLGLLLMVCVYCILLMIFAKKNPFWFLKKLSPAQLLAFSTSSSSATLPVTMERVEEHIGVDKEISSFVLPIGATINMDGTSLYQAVAAVFVMQVLWPEGLVFSNQLMIVLTALMASIGSAGVPGAGMVMLIIVLESVGFDEKMYPIALALIFAVDRPLDMLRTVINVTGDATVSVLVAKSEGKLHKPNPRHWDDNYEQVK